MEKRGYKLHAVVAHAGNVNCLSFGKKNCRVFITGGDDQKVNLWSVGKPTSLMSLCGHTSPVESASFDSAEVLVAAGSSSGAIKLWDMEETKLVRTLTGHRSYCTAVEFHPFGEFFASGSMDTNLKIWDIRKKGCIHTYKGHTRGISTIRFSPDGRWVVSGGFDNVIKVWDLTAGKLLHDFKFHEGHVRSIEFHPVEFLLATGSADKTVKFWDLETFEMIGSTKRESSGVRAITFNPDGRSIFCGFDDSLKVYSWEPVICHESVDMGWSTLGDLCVHDGKLLGGAYYENSVAIWVADISLMERNGSRLAQEQLGQPDQKTDSYLEKEESQVKSKSNLRPATPDSDSKEIKTIYVDSAGINSITSNPVDAPKPVLRRLSSLTSRKVDPVDALKVALPSDSKDISTAGTQKWGPTVNLPTKSSVSAGNRSLVVPNIVPRDDPSGRDPVGSRRNSLAPAARTSISVSAKSNTRRLSDNRFDMDRMSVSLESVSSDNLNKSLVSTKGPTLHARVVADENANESSEGKQSSIKTVEEKLDRTSVPSTASSTTSGDLTLSSIKGVKPVTVIKGVAVVHGRTRSLVERFERREITDVLESDTPTMSAEPMSFRVTPEPASSCVTSEPASSRMTSEPASSRTTSETASSRTTSEPTSSRMISEPTSFCTTSEPASFRTIPEPMDSCTIPEPTDYCTSPEPSASRMNSVPMASRMNSVPIASRMNFVPVVTHLIAEPTEVPSSKNGDQQILMSEEPTVGDKNIMENLMQDHDVLLSTFRSRLTKLQVVRHFWGRNDVKGTINAVKKLPDRAVQADVVGVLIDRMEIITLDLFSGLLPVLLGLLESKVERHATVSSEMLLKLVAVFGTVVRSTVSAPPAVGVDLHLEERRECCRQCFSHLQNVHKFLPELVKRGGVVARCARQLNLVLQQVL